MKMCALFLATLLCCICPATSHSQEPGLVNIAPLATVTSRPGGRFLKRIIDGHTGSGYTPAYHEYLPNFSYFFRFSSAIPIRKIRFTLPPNYYSLWADTNGDGTYNHQLVTVTTGPTSYLWGVTDWTYGEWAGEPVEVFGLRLDQPSIYKFSLSGSHGNPPQQGSLVYQYNTAGTRQHRSGTVIALDGDAVWIQQSNGEGWNWQSSGWLAADPSDPTNRWEYAVAPANANPLRQLYEFEIYSNQTEMPADAAAALAALNSPELEDGVPVLLAGETVSVATPPTNQQYLKGMYIEVWMLGLAQWIGQSPRGDLRNWLAYQAMVARLKAIDANFVWLMPIRSGWLNGNYTGDWYNSEVLWPSNYLASSSPENYLKILTAALHADGLKIFAGDRPSAWTAKAGVAQSEVWPGVAAEMAASGIDGIAVVFDEGGNQASADQLSQYAAAADAAGAVNPNILTFTNLQVPSGTNRTFAVFAHKVDVDLLGTEGYFTLEDPWGHWNPAFHTAEMVGANPHQRAIITQNVAWAPLNNNPLFYETFTPVCLYGPTLSTVFQGGEAIAYWRLSFQNNEYTDAHVPKGYAMLDTLAAWGARTAQVPSDIVVLETNRQAERFAYTDFVYQLLPNFPDANKTGYYNVEAVYEVLLKAGLPYQARFVEYPQDFPDLSKVKVIILPFTYVSSTTEFPNETLSYLQQAVEQGVKLIILHRPPVHRYYQTFTGFANLLEANHVTVLDDDLSYGLTPDSEQKILSKVQAALGGKFPVSINTYHQDIEVALLEGTVAEREERYVLATNWEPHGVVVDLGVELPPGEYRILQRDLANASVATLANRTVFSEIDLKKFRVNLAAGEAKVLYILPSHFISAPQNLQLVSPVMNN